MTEPQQKPSPDIRTPTASSGINGSDITVPDSSVSREFDGTMENHVAIIRSNALRQANDQSFENRLDNALDTARASDPGRQGEVNALLQFKDDSHLTPKQILRIADELSIRGASAETLQFFDAQKKVAVADGAQALFNSSEVKRIEATQLQRSGRYDEAVRTSDELLARNPMDAEAWRSKAMALVAEAGRDQTMRAAALGTFEEGFVKTGNYSLGMGALNASLETGNIDHAQKLAPLVSLAAKNIGADQSKSFWPALINAEATAVGGNEMEHRAAMLHLVDVLGSKDEHGTPLVSDKNKEIALARLHEASGANPEVAKILAPVADRLEMSLHIKPETPLPYQKEENVETVFTERGYHSRQGLTPEGLSIKGNVRTGSLLPDSSTGIKDKEQFLEVAHTPLSKFVESGLINAHDLPEGVSIRDSIADIKDVKTQILSTQLLVRGIYDVDERHLEDLHGIDHKVYDSVVRLRLQHAGATTPLDLTKQEQEAYSVINEKGNESLYRAIVTADKLPAEECTALNAKLHELPAFRDIPHDADIAGAAKQLIEKAELYKRSDTQTSTAVSAEQGIGDCRQVASATENIVSVVQQEKTARFIIQSAHSLAQNDMDGYQHGKEQASRELNGHEMRVYDQSVMAAVEVEKKYEPVKTADGRFVAAADDRPQLIETHMHNVVRLEDKFVVADSFYQKGPYHMGWVENNAPETVTRNGMTMLRLQGGEVEAVICQRDGEGKLIRDSEGHPVPVLDEAGNPKVIKTPVILESTKYSGPDRIQLDRSGPDMYLNGASVVPESNLLQALQDPKRADAYKKLATFAVDHHDSEWVHNKEIKGPEELQAARASLKRGKEPNISEAEAKIPASSKEAVRELERLYQLQADAGLGSPMVATSAALPGQPAPARDTQENALSGNPSSRGNAKAAPVKTVNAAGNPVSQTSTPVPSASASPSGTPSAGPPAKGTPVSDLSLPTGDMALYAGKAIPGTAATATLSKMMSAEHAPELSPASPPQAALSPEVPLPRTEPNIRALKAGAGAGVGLGAVGTYEAFKRGDVLGGAVAIGNFITSGVQLRQVLKPANQLTPEMETNIEKLEKANVPFKIDKEVLKSELEGNSGKIFWGLTVVDGYAQIRKEHGTEYKLQRAAAVSGVAGTGALAGAATVGLGGTATVASALLVPLAVGYLADKSIEVSRLNEQRDKEMAAVKTDFNDHSNLQKEEKVLARQLDADGISKDARGHYDASNQADSQKIYKELLARENMLSETIRDNFTRTPTLTEALLQERKTIADAQVEIKTLKAAEAELGDEYVKAHPDVAAAAKSVAQPSLSLIHYDRNSTSLEAPLYGPMASQALVHK